jgi:hypothetical protein
MDVARWILAVWLPCMSASSQLPTGLSRPAGLISAIAVLAMLHFNIAAWAFGLSLGAAAFVAVAMLALGLVIWRYPVQGTFLVLSLVVLGLMILSSPTVGWDARSIWFFHAKRIWFGNSLYAYLDHYATWSHNDYPPLLAATAATLAHSLARWNEVFPRLSVLLLLLPVLLGLLHLLANRVVFVAALASLFVFALKVEGFGLLTGYMDLLLGLYYAVTVMLLVSLPPLERCSTISKDAFWPLASLILFMSILPMLKNEGVLGGVVIFGLFAIRARRRPKLILFASFAFLPWLLMWKVPVIASGVSGDLFGSGLMARLLARLTDWSSLSPIFGSVLRTSWPSILVFLTVVAVLGRRDPAGWVISGGFFAVYTLALVAIYLLTPKDLIWHLTTSASRTYGAACCVLLGYVFQEIDWAAASPTPAATTAAPSNPS